MRERTTIWGHSRGYRTLAVVALAGCMLSALLLVRRGYLSTAPLAGTAGFMALFLYAWARAARRTPVVVIEELGFSVVDPALPLGLVHFGEIEEVRIYATLANPVVAFRFHDPDTVRRRAPAAFRLALKGWWRLHHYHVVVQLDHLNDQVAAIQSTALRAGVPVTSELV